MPPRPKRQAAATATNAISTSTRSQSTQSTRRKTLAKQNSLSQDEEHEIHEAFTLFAIPSSSAPAKDSENDDEETGELLVLPTSTLRKTLIALNTPPTSARELRELIETLDPDETGEIRYEHFVAVAALKLQQSKALSSSSKKGKGKTKGKGKKRVTRDDEDEGGYEDEEDEEREAELARAFALFTSASEITIKDLRRVARSLREEVDDEVLRDMVREANGGGTGRDGVGREAFAGVLERAGVLG